MSNISEFLRTEAAARRAMDDGIWTLLIEAAEKIEKQLDERQKLDRRIHNQRLALRQNWQIVESRASHSRAWIRSPLLMAMLKTRRRQLPYHLQGLADLLRWAYRKAHGGPVEHG